MGIINRNNALSIAIGADPSDLYSRLTQAEVRIDQFGNYVKNTGDKIGMFLSAGFGGAVLTDFAKEVINVRGEIQQLEIAFETMLGTKERADQMMADVKDLALRSPFTLTEVADNTKQLIAMGIATEDAVETVKALGDVSAGVAVPLSRIAINYGQVAALGRLQSREIRDFAMAGIPIVDELAKMLGKTSAEIFEMVEAGKVGFPAVEQAFKNMSSEGGKFYNLMEKQNASVTGQISKLKDSFQLMYNEIGQSSEGVIYSAIEGASLLIENYEAIGKIVLEIAAAYGIYKAALIAFTTAENAQVAVSYKLLTAESRKNISKQNLIKGSMAYNAAIRDELVAQGQRTIATLTEKKAKLELALAEQVAHKSVLQNTVATKAEIVAQNANIAATKRKIAITTGKIASTNAEILGNAKNIASLNLLTIAKAKATAAGARLNAVIAANPYVAAGILIAGVAFGIYKLITAQTDAEKAQKRLNDAMKEAEKASLSETRELAKLKGELSAATKGTEEYEKIKDKIVSGYGKYYDGLEQEIDKVGLLDETYKKLTDSINASFGARQYEKFAQSESDNLDEVMSKNLGKIQDRLIDKLGDEAGSKYYAKIREAILNGEVSVESGFLSSGLDPETQAALDKVSGKDGGAFDITNRAVEGYIKNIVTAQKITDDLDKKARKRFGIDNQAESNAESADTKTEQSLDNITVKIKEASKAVANLRQQLSDLRSGKTQVTEGTLVRAIEDKAKELQEAEKRLETLTGVNPRNSGKDSDRLLKEKLDLENRLNDELLKLQQDNISAGIAIMEDGYEKRLALINNEYDREIAAIRQKEQEWRDAQGGQLTVEQTSAIDKADENAYRKRMQLEESLRKEAADAEKQSWIDYNREYGGYQAKRLAITEDYANRIAATQTGGEKASLSAERDKALQELDQSMVEQSGLWVRLFDDADRQTNEFIKKIIAETEQLLDYLNGVEGATIPVGFTPEQLEALKKDPDKVKDILDGLIKKRDELNSRNPFGQLIKGFKDLKKASTDADKKEAFANISSGLESASGMISDVGGALQNILGDKAAETVDNVTTALSGMAQTGSGVAKVMAGDFTGIVDILKGIPAMIDGFSGLFDGGNDNAKLQKQIEKYNEIVGLYDTLIDKQKEYLETLTGADAQKQAAEIENMIKRQTAAAQSGLEAWFKSGSSWKSHSEGWHFKKNFAKELGINEVGDIFDFDAAKWESLYENVELWQRLPEEVRAYGLAVIEGREETEGLARTMEEIATGVSFDSFRDGFLDALLDMDSSAEDFADNVESYLQKAIMNSLVSEKFDARIKNLYDKFVEYGKSGEKVDQAEYNELMSMRDQLVEDMVKEREALKEVFSWESDPDSSTSDNSLSGAYSKASQESVDLLGGTMGAIRVILEDMKRMMAGSVTFDASAFYRSFQDSLQAIRDLQAKGWEDVKAIRDLSRAVSENTAEIARLTEEQGKTLVSINNNTEAAANRLNGTLDVKQKGGGGLGS